MKCLWNIFLLLALVSLASGDPAGACGKTNGKTCPDNECCSKFGFCGTTEEYCGAGCDPKYGKCGMTNNPVTTCSVSNSFAITYDDGPSEYSKELLQKLGDTKATFFLNGNNWYCIYDYADDVTSLMKEGHMLGAHTWSHPELPLLSTKEIKYQFLKLNEALYKITGCRPRYFRPPYGAYDDRVNEIAHNLDMDVIIWDVDSTDTAEKSTVDSQKAAISNFLQKNPAPAPHIILGHETHQTTVEQITPFLLDAVKGGGWSEMSVGQCLENDPKNWYVCDRKPAKRDDTWRCSENDKSLASGGKLEFEISNLILEGKAKGYSGKQASHKKQAKTKEQMRRKRARASRRRASSALKEKARGYSGKQTSHKKQAKTKGQMRRKRARTSRRRASSALEGKARGYSGKQASHKKQAKTKGQMRRKRARASRRRASST